MRFFKKVPSIKLVIDTNLINNQQSTEGSNETVRLYRKNI